MTFASVLGGDSRINFKKYYLERSGASVDIGASGTWCGLLLIAGENGNNITSIDYYYPFNKDFGGLNLKREANGGAVTATCINDSWSTFVVMLWNGYML